MAAEHKETLPVIWKMAALMELCPPDVEDVVYKNVDGVSEDYDQTQAEDPGVGREQSRGTPWGPFPWTSAGYTIRSRTSVSNRKMSGAVTMNTVLAVAGT